MNLSPESEVYLKYVGRYLSWRENVFQAMFEARKNPEIVGETIAGIDRAVDSLNQFRAQPDNVAQTQGDLLPNSLLIREKLEGIYKLPTATELAHDRSRSTINRATNAFVTANWFMARGEGNKRNRTWSFHKGIKDPGTLSDVLGLEVYRTFISWPYPELLNNEYKVMLALEEMLAMHHQDTRLFRSVKPWITVKEGFSEELVRSLSI